MHPLDNAVWHALCGPQVTVAERRPLAARYQPDVAPFAALPDRPDVAAWDELRALVGPGHGAVLFRGDVGAPDGWEVMFQGEGPQMVLEPDAFAEAPGAAARIVDLGRDDVGEMLDLVERTRPGPFLARTVELGTYVGTRENGALIAMAGERIHLDGHTEISAVCTDPGHRGRGLASTLVREVVHRIHRRGERAFLHVAAGNDAAISLYESLGFAFRRTTEFAALRAPA